MIRIRALWERSREHPWASLLLVAVVSRLALALVATVAGSVFPQSVAPPEGWNAGFGPVHWFARWDSGWYADIAEAGYGFEPESWAFSPGYPMVIALVRAPLPFLDPIDVGFAVSNLAFLADVVLLYELTRRLFDDAFAHRSALMLAVAPGTVYLSAVYAEPLFLLFCLAFFIAANEEHWALAGLLAGLGAITRPTGVGLFLALVVALVLCWRREGKPPLRGAAWAGAGLLLPALFLAYSQWKTGNALISIDTREAYWPNTGWHQPFAQLKLAFLAPGVRLLVYGGLAALLLGCGYAVWDLVRRRHLPALPVYAFAFASAAFYLTYAETLPIVRYLIPVIPVYWAAAEVTRRPRALRTLLAGSAAVAAVVTGLFATWGPLY